MADRAALVRKGFEAFAEGDIAALQQLLSPDIVWHISGTNPVSGDYKGAEEVVSMFGRIAEETGGSFSLDLHAVTEGDEHAVAIARGSATRKGRNLTSNYVFVFHVDESDRVTEVWDTPWDQAAVDAFWS